MIKEVFMKKQQVSFEMSAEDHKNLKICCVELGVSMKDFIITATMEKVIQIQQNRKKDVDHGR
jgi:hypothetical protein